MLFLTNVTDWRGVGRNTHIINKATGTQYVFDVNNISNLRAEGTGSKFNYLVGSSNRKTGYEEVHCDTSYATIKAEFDIKPISSAMTLQAYPNNDLTKTPITTYINIHDFCYAWSHNPYPQYTWLVYTEKGRGEKRVLVNMTLLSLLQLDTPFDEVNVQWFYFVDPEELIHPTWYVRVTPLESIKNGMLYNWYAAVDTRLITSTGWRIPSNVDFNVLKNYLGGEAVAGGKLKETGIIYWTDPNVGATNEVGFNARGSGFRSIAGWMGNIRQIFEVWTTDELNAVNAYVVPILNSDTAMPVGSNATSKKYGCSLRPIKNTTTLTHGETGTYTGNDGKTYRTICIGTQEWVADNLTETKYRDGTVVPEITDDLIWGGLSTGALCTYNNDWGNI